MNDTDCIIPLTQGKFATVSPEDYDYLSQFKWCAHKDPNSYGYRWYALRFSSRRTGHRMIHMHHEVARRAGLRASRQYDHKDRDGLNNRRSNIRPCTNGQNGANRSKTIGFTSKWKGVGWFRGKWVARIRFRGDLIYLGRFADETEAADAYAEAARLCFGEFANPAVATTAPLRRPQSDSG